MAWSASAVCVAGGVTMCTTSGRDASNSSAAVCDDDRQPLGQQRRQLVAVGRRIGDADDPRAGSA